MAKDEQKGGMPEPTEEQKIKRGRKTKPLNFDSTEPKELEEPKGGDSAMAKHMMMLQAENNELKARLQQAISQLRDYAQSDFYQRLEWCWRIITTPGMGEELGSEFYDKVVNDFKELMFPSKVPPTQE